MVGKYEALFLGNLLQRIYTEQPLWDEKRFGNSPNRRLGAREGSHFPESSVIIRDKILIELNLGMFLSDLFNTPVTRVF